MRWHRYALAGAALVLCSPFGRAQNPDGPYWTEYPLPPQTQSVTALGSLAMIRTATDVHLYSGLRRAWTVQPVSSNALIQIANRYCVIEDGTTVHAWSAATGQVVSLATSGAATVHIGSASSSWTICVQDGSTLHAFSSFLGQWVPLSIQGAINAISVDSHVALVVDDVQAHAFSAYFGTWVSHPIRLTGFFEAFRSGAIAAMSGPDEIAAFSAYQNTWASAPMPGAINGLIEAQDGYAAMVVGNEVALFSTISGKLLRLTTGGPATLHTCRNAAVLQIGNQLDGYAPGTDSLVPLPPLGPASNLTMGSGSLGSFALIPDGTGVTAFSGLNGSVAASPPGSYTLTAGGVVAFAENPSGTSYAYSALQGAWVAAPNVPLNDVRVNFETVVIGSSSTFEGFSARTLSWSSLPSSTGFLEHQTSGALSTVVEPGRIDAFDTRLGRWVGQPTPNPAAVSLWRLTGIASDGTRAYGYSLFHNTWEAVDLQGTVVTYRANSSIGFVETTSHMYVFTGSGSLSNQSRFPEFSRFCARGGDLVHQQFGPPQTAVLGIFGTQVTEIRLLPFGTLWIDPSSLVSIPLGFIPAGGSLTTRIAIPNIPELNGQVLHMQDLLFPPSGSPWLSNFSSPMIW